MLHQLFVTVTGKYQKSKKIATNSNYLRCHALLTVLHFPLETTCPCKQDTKERYWGQQFGQMERDISVRPTEMTRPVTVDHLQSWSPGGAGSEVWKRVYMIAPVKKFGRVRLSTIFLQNKYGGECRHGGTMSFCSVLSFTASKRQEKVFKNVSNGIFGHQEAFMGDYT